MTTYVALLRGINVGGRQKVAMADLRDLLRGLGYADVRTHLQSGNAVFTSMAKPAEKVEREIEKAITKEFGLTVRCLVRSRQELAAVVEQNTLPTTDPAKLLVAFLSAPPAASYVRGLDPAEFAPEEFRVVDREVYLWCPRGVTESKIVPAFSEKRLDRVATARNWRTVTKLLDLAAG